MHGVGYPFMRDGERMNPPPPPQPFATGMISAGEYPGGVIPGGVGNFAEITEKWSQVQATADRLQRQLGVGEDLAYRCAALVRAAAANEAALASLLEAAATLRLARARLPAQIEAVASLMDSCGARDAMDHQYRILAEIARKYR